MILSYSERLVLHAQVAVMAVSLYDLYWRSISIDPLEIEDNIDCVLLCRQTMYTCDLTQYNKNVVPVVMCMHHDDHVRINAGLLCWLAIVDR